MTTIKGKVTSMLLITALGTSLVAGGSAALFTANASNTNNTFASGSVSIVTAATPVFATTDVVFNNMAPGDAGTRTINVTNTGTLDAWVRVKQITTSGPLFGGATPLTLNNFEVFKVSAGGTQSYSINYDFKKAADNTYQGANGTANIEFEAVQVKNNPNPWTLAKSIPGNANILIGTINVTSSSQNLELDVSSLFSPELSGDWPDLNITSPSGETFGFASMYVNGLGSLVNTSNNSSTKVTYTGFSANPEKMSFENPIVGTWKVEVHNGNSGTSTAIVSSNQQIQ